MKSVVGAAQTGDAPTTSEWSPSLFPTKVRLILEVWQYSLHDYSVDTSHDYSAIDTKIAYASMNAGLTVSQALLTHKGRKTEILKGYQTDNHQFEHRPFGTNNTSGPVYRLYNTQQVFPRRHNMDISSALLALFERNPSVTIGFLPQRALVFSLVSTRTICWTNSRVVGDLKSHNAYVTLL